MGENINLLSERIIGNKGHGNDTRLELIENIHWHYRDFRFVFKGKEFYNIADMFEQAKQKYIDVGMPEVSVNQIGLGETALIDNGYHSNRLGCELTSDGTIHVHYRDLRIHMKQADFLVFAETLYQGLLTLSEINTKLVHLENVIIPEIAKNNYSKYLKEYDEGKYEKVSADDVILYYMKIKYYERGADKGKDSIQRPNGLPNPYPGSIPEDIDKKYLFAMYESIKKYGYANGPFLNEYIVAYKIKDNSDIDKIYVTGAHRVSVLIHLGYKEISVVLVDQESQ